MSAVDEVRSAVEAVQKMMGLSWSRMIALAGPVVGCFWLYSSVSTSVSSGGQMARPLAVARQFAAVLGVPRTGFTSAAEWVADHHELFGPVLSGAIVLACLAAKGSETSSSHTSLATLLLLVAIQIQGVVSVVVFVLVTGAVAATAAVLEHRADRSGLRWRLDTSCAMVRWVTGPFGMVVLWAILPLLVLGAMVDAFRGDATGARVAEGAQLVGLTVLPQRRSGEKVGYRVPTGVSSC